MTKQSRWLHTTTIPALLILVLAFAWTGIGAAQNTRPTADDAPAIIAVKFHADWCGYCKAMGPVFEELQAKYDQQPVLFVTFDQTREFNRQQSRYLAQAMGLNDAWTQYGGKTGFILLIDAGSKKVVERLDHEQTLKQIGAALQNAVADAR